MSDTPHPASTLTETPISFPDVPSDGLELGNLASSFARAMLGPFEVHDVIGRGGMGIVFSGVHVVQETPVAIKVITRRGAEQPRLRQVMHNEVRAVAGLEHPGIVRVLDYGDIPTEAEIATEGALRAGSPYFVMEMMAHSSLIDVAGRLTWRQVRTILLNLLDALAHSHARDVIHRDIKPGNILLDDWGGRVIPKIADFGLAFATRQPTDVSRSIGTPQYMAPEQIETPWRKHGPWSDLYSVGCLAFELLTGRKLFHGSSILEIFRLHLDGMRKPLRSIVRVPLGFEVWFHRMIERNVRDRYRSAADAARDLAALDEEVPDIVPPDHVSHEFALLTPTLGDLSKTPPERFGLAKRFPVSMHLVGAGLGLFGLREIPLAGRTDELASLWDAFGRTAEEGVRVVTIRGAHGTGKTKLVDAFVQRLTEVGAAVGLRANHSAAGSPEDGAPMMLARWLRAAGATRAEAAGIVRDDLGADRSKPFAWESVIALIEPTLAGGSDAKVMFEFGSRARRHDVVVRQMRRAAKDQPLLAVFDDAHFGEDSLELIAHLLREAAELPVLVLITVCDEELAVRTEASELLANIEALPQAERLELGALDGGEHLNLIQDLLLLSGDLAIAVADRTHGNPGFAVSLIDDWIGNGYLEVGETGFILQNEADLLGGGPSSAQELWEGMLERVFAEHSEDEKMSVELAAALGVSIWSDEWIKVCEQEGLEPCWSAVGDLVDRRLATMTATGWRFEHPVAAEYLRGSAEQAGRWTRWKEACARLLASNDVDTPEKLQRLGEYWLGAGQFENAVEPLHESAKTNLMRGQFREAERLSTGMAKALLAADGTTEYELARVHTFRSRIYMGMGRSDEALRWAKKALLIGEENAWADVIAIATGFTALAKRWQGDADADEWLDRALKLLSAIDAADQADGVLMVLGYLLTSLGRFDDAKRVLELDYQRARESEDERALASSAYQRCRTAIYMREFESARAFGEEARKRFTQMGHAPALSSALAMLAEVARLDADLEQAEALYRESIALAESVGFETFVSQASLATVLLAQLQYHEAEELFLDAANRAAAVGRRRTAVACRAGLLVCAVEQGHWSSAARLLPMIEAFTATTAETEIDLAQLLERAGDGFQADGHAIDARRVWEMALKQWETLGADDHAGEVTEKLRALDE